MGAPPGRPKVRRDLAVQPIMEGGRRLLLIEDPFGIIPEPIALSELGGLILSLLDGERTLPEIESEFRRAVGEEIPAGFLADQIRQVSEIGLLEDEKYHRERSLILDRYTAHPTRPASHAGTAYEGEADRLREWIDSVIGGPPVESADDSAPRLVVAPHIDFRVNTEVYAGAYRPLRGREVDRVVLMGTGHSILEGIYSPSAKSFSTPLGETAADRGAVERLVQVDHGVVPRHDFAHRSEHALEFQLVFLQHLLGADRFELVPILCGSLQDRLDSANRLGEVEEVRPFLDALRGIIHEPGRRTLVVAGIDFSHVGLRFSHPQPASLLLEETRRHDHQLIEAFEAWDAEGFWRTEAESGGRFNVCGFSTLATLLETMDPVASRCVAYDVWDDSPTGSAVTFAAIVG